ncbi:recombinase family protein [Homoserinimonas sp. A447]
MGIIGYARVSTSEQSLNLQRDAFAAVNVERVFEDHGVSGRLASRPGLDACLDFLREGDTLAVYRLDRLGRSTRHTLELLHQLDARGIGFRSLTESIDTGGPMGRAMITIIAAFAQLEADVSRERTMAGLAAARERGRVGGRPPALTPAMVEVARTMIAAGRRPGEVAAELGVGRSTIYRALTSSG